LLIVAGANVVAARDAHATRTDDELRTGTDNIGVAPVGAWRYDLVGFEGELVVAQQAETRRDLPLRRNLRHRQQNVLHFGASHIRSRCISGALSARDVREEHALAPRHDLVAHLHIQAGAADVKGVVRVSGQQLRIAAGEIARVAGEVVEHAVMVDRIRRIVVVGAVVGLIVEHVGPHENAPVVVLEIHFAEQADLVFNQLVLGEVAVAVVAVDIGGRKQIAARRARAHAEAIAQGEVVIERCVRPEVDRVASPCRRTDRGCACPPKQHPACGADPVHRRNASRPSRLHLVSCS
jgi:hypothetical protein